MKILILGGTLFLGKHIAQAALDAGHAVTLFHRGKTNPDLFPAAEHRLGDRKSDLSALEPGTWDAVIDTSGYEPQHVDASARLLESRVGQYLFVSTISVYPDPVPPGADEGAALATLSPDADRTLSGETYGPLKVECEARVKAHFGDRSLIVRPGLIVGPDDPTDRFTYWPMRVAAGGDVLIPAGDDIPVQWIDVRDLAEWSVKLVEAGQNGIFNATGPALPCTLRQLLEICRTALVTDCRFVPVAESFLLEQNVAPFADLPLWLPAENSGLMQIDITRALNAGLLLRPAAATVLDTVAWRQSQPDRPLAAGLNGDREAEILAAWAAQ